MSIERNEPPSYTRIDPPNHESPEDKEASADIPDISGRLSEIEMNLAKQPAKIYDLTVLSSLLARCNVKNLTKETSEQIVESYNIVTEILEKSVKPDVVHNDPALLNKSLDFMDRIAQISNSEGVKKVLKETEQERVGKILDTIRQRCQSLLEGSDKKEFFVSADEIEKSFGLKIFSEEEVRQAKDDLSRWQEIEHPDVPIELQSQVNSEKTAKLIEYFKAEVFGLKPRFPVDVYTEGDSRDYHLFWSLKADAIDYYTPESYDIATQLSFDIPHNIAHIAHLEAINKKGVTGFVDLMNERAFFEGVAVLSESLMVDVVKKDEHAEEIKRILIPNEALSGKVLAKWITQDRSHEFRLRAVRLLGDVLTLQGGKFDEIVDEVANVVSLTREKAHAEVSKYYAFTGLGAVYTLGYRKFWESKIYNPGQAITGKDKPLTSWQMFDAS